MRLFIAAAEELNFTAAAARSGITQSALTAAIRAIEGALSLRLFDRTTRRVTLTKEGQTFLAVAQRLVEDIDVSLEGVLSAAERLRGHVALSSSSFFLGYVACPALVHLSRTHPEVTVRLTEKTVDEAIPAVLSGELDFAIVGLVDPHSDLAWVTVARDTFGVIGRRDVLPDKGRPYGWADLDPRTYVALAQGLGIRQLIDRNRPLATELGRAKYEVASTRALMMLLQEGVGYSLLPAMTAYLMMPHRDMVFQVLQSPAISRELHLIKRRGRTLSPAAAALLEQFVPRLASLQKVPSVDVLLDAGGIQTFVAS
jgi:DNA-binding transcriptional LysR family regulator